MANKHLAIIAAILLLGAALRFHALGQDVRFHPDEALFVTFARQAAVQGDWLLHGSLDKPPLTIYINALALTAFGIRPLPNGVLTLDLHAGEFAARIPGVFASMLLVALTYALAKQLYPDDKKVGNSMTWTPYLASLVMALSPLAVAFSATAFTDGLMLLCVVVAVWVASRRHWFWAGFWITVGLWCKQQGLLYVPLVIGIGWICEGRAGGRLSLVKGLRFVVPILLGIVLLLVWDGARGQETSMWTLATVNNDPGRLARWDEVLTRLAEWWQVGRYLVGAGAVTIALGVVAVVGLVKRTRTSMPGDGWIDGALAAYVIVYLLVHWLVAINIYDRYLLLILLPVVLLIARGLHRLTDGYKDAKIQGLVILTVLALCLPTAWEASQNKLPMGGDGGRHNGIEQVADYLNRQRLGAIVYDHWLGWELGYYMGTWSDKRRVYYPTPEALAADALLQADRAPRYLVVPDWADAGEWLSALRGAKFEVVETYYRAPFAVYELQRP